MKLILKTSYQDMKITDIKNDKVIQQQENNIDCIADRKHVAILGYN